MDLRYVLKEYVHVTSTSTQISKIVFTGLFRIKLLTLDRGRLKRRGLRVGGEGRGVGGRHWILPLDQNPEILDLPIIDPN